MKPQRRFTWKFFFVPILLSLCLQVAAQDVQPDNVFSTKGVGKPEFPNPLPPLPARVTPTVPPGTYISPWLIDVVKLLKARVDDAVIVTFIDSAGTFNLDADKIIYLRDSGLSGEMLAMMIQHDAEIVAGLRPIPPAPSASSAISFVPTPAPVPVALSPGLPRPSTNSVNLPVVPSLAKTPPPEATPRAEDKAAELEPPSAPVLTASARTPSLPSLTSPVRLPYAVQFLDPIVVVRSPGRVPNVMVLEIPW